VKKISKFSETQKPGKKFPGEKIDIYIHGHPHRLRNKQKNSIKQKGNQFFHAMYNKHIF